MADRAALGDTGYIYTLRSLVVKISRAEIDCPNETEQDRPIGNDIGGLTLAVWRECESGVRRTAAII